MNKSNETGWLQRLAEIATLVSLPYFSTYVVGWVALCARLSDMYPYFSINELLYAVSKIANLSVVLYGMRTLFIMLPIVAVAITVWFWAMYIKRNRFTFEESQARTVARILRFTVLLSAGVTVTFRLDDLPGNMFRFLQLVAIPLLVLVLSSYYEWRRSDAARAIYRKALSLYSVGQYDRLVITSLVAVAAVISLIFPPGNPLPCLTRKLAGPQYSPEDGSLMSTQSMRRIGLLLGQSDGYWYVIDEYEEIEARPVNDSIVMIVGENRDCVWLWEE